MPAAISNLECLGRIMLDFHGAPLSAPDEATTIIVFAWAIIRTAL